jgi:beta-lactamase class A
VLGAFASPPDEAAVTAHFAPSFTAQIPAPQIVQRFEGGAQVGALTLDHVDEGASPTELVALAHAGAPGSPADGAPHVRIDLAVDAAEPHAIVTLLFRPVAATATSWDDVEARLRTVAPETAMLAAEIEGGRCTPVAGMDAKKTLAIGSAFKLYVLDALARDVAAGKRAWDDPVTIEESKKSLPPTSSAPADLQGAPAGTKLPARTLAEKMIAASDNTATDHLVAFVGRAAVEDAVKASGHSAPARMVPFLTTRDLFAMKLLGSPAELEAYEAADVAHRRKLLEGYEQRDLSSVSGDQLGWPKPRAIDTIEWFASPDDLCKLALGLKALGDAPKTSPVLPILAANPGLADEKHAFSYVGFKGGSEPGVMNLTWLLRRKKDDKWLFFTVTFNDPAGLIDSEKAALAAGAARDLLGN